MQAVPAHESTLSFQVLDIKDDLERHEEAKELVILLTTEAKNDPEIRAQVGHVRREMHLSQPKA